MRTRQGAGPTYVDTGINWLREIPANWQVRRLRYLASGPLMYGANEAASETDPSFPRFVRITDISEDGSLRPETFRSLPSEIAEPYLLREGDILLARSGATVGKTFIYRKEWGKACFAGYLIRFPCNRDLLLPRFPFLLHTISYLLVPGSQRYNPSNHSKLQRGEVRGDSSSLTTT